jgi:hypothetical protein
VRCEHVGFLDAFGINRLVGRNVGQCPQTVPVLGSGLKLEFFRGIFHELLIHGAHGLAFTFKKPHRVIGKPAIIVERDFPGAGRGAALDLVQQTRARAVLVETVRTGAQ